ncbi:MAG: EVE domain-containing protein [bacterium]|nr:EVE domain-containing protein [bacterium]
MIQYWLLKTEPTVFSMDDLMNAPMATTTWDGIRNYQARNYLLQMRINDYALIYHSKKKPQHVAGVAKIVKEAEIDPTQLIKNHPFYDKRATIKNPIWYQVKVQGIKKAKEMVTLDQLKRTEELSELVLLRNHRLSVQPLKEFEFFFILNLMGITI